VNLLILSRIYFYSFWIFLLLSIFTLQNTVWPFFFGTIVPPNLFLNTLILFPLLIHKPSILSCLIASFISSVGSSFGFGYYLLPYALLFMFLLFIKLQTFFLNEKNLLWLIVGSHLFVYLTQELTFILWTKKPWFLPFFDLALTISLSAFCFPFQRHLFKKLLARWRHTKWGEVGYE
jgi:hypothetical protein